MRDNIDYFFERLNKKVFFLIAIVVPVLFNLTTAHAQALNIAVIEADGLSNIKTEIFKSEIKALFEGEREVNFISYPLRKGDSSERAQVLLTTASTNKKTDLVLVLDIAANQTLGKSISFPKPTFLPYVFNASYRGLPLSGGSSGKKNLNYLTFNSDFEQELNTFQSVASFSNVVLIIDPRVEKSIDSKMIAEIELEAKKAGANLSTLTFSGDVDNVLASFPENAEAILYGFYPNATKAQTKALIDGVNSRGLASFSLPGEEYVRLGALATNSSTTNWEKLARRTALHMQDVLLGKPASELPVLFKSAKGLMINMATSRQIRVAPSFDVLAEALLINVLPETADRNYSLTEVARMAVKENLSLAAQRLQAESAKESVDEVRGALLPQIGSSLEYSKRKDDTNNVRNGILAKNSTDGSITLNQSLFSERLWAAFAIEKYSALSESELVKEVELDITQDAVNTYLTVLLEKTSLEQERYNLNITRENYRLAQNRVEVGTETAADLYRWQSELANAKQGVLSAKSSFEQQKQKLNQILNRPINEEFTTTVETLDNPDLLISDHRITDLIENSYRLEALTDFFVNLGLERAPELKQTYANISASKRQLKSDQRAYWLPSVSLASEYNSNISEDRVASGFRGEDNDWRVGIEFSLPLYEGGARSARTAQSRLSVRQFETKLSNTKNQIEQGVRNNMEASHASYNSISLAQQAETAAQKNYELVNDSYAQGAKDITDVLDAQDTLIEAREASMNAVYDFLIDLMNVQRAIGAYDFFLTDTQRMELSDDLIIGIGSRNQNKNRNINDE